MFSACINSRLLSASPFRLKCSAFRWQAGGTRRCLSSLRYRVSKGAGTVVGSDVAGPPRRLISMSSGDHAALMKEAAQLVPPLSPESHKGSHGKVAVVGGSREYTGAPYFAAFTALRVGADLSHVFCTSGAATVIKSYSPELIVMPYLPHLEEGEDASSSAAQQRVAAAMELVAAWLGRMSAVVVGPGLGDDPLALATASRVIQAARQAGLPLLVDGSGLNIIARQPELVQGYRRCILTPNMAELGRLAAGVGMPLEGPIATAWQRHLPELAQRFSGVTIVSKGPVDLIADGSGLVLTCDVPSSPRRAGGQGDVLAGATAAFMAWSSKRAAAAAPAGSGGGDGSQSGGSSTDFSNPMMVAAYAGCTVTRTASVLAFKEQRRAMLAGDVISHLGASFASLFGE